MTLHDTLWISAEYPGRICQLLESRLYGSTALFFQGAGANARPRVTVDGDVGWKSCTFDELDDFATVMANNIQRAMCSGGLRPINLGLAVTRFVVPLETEVYPKAHFEAIVSDASRSPSARAQAQTVLAHGIGQITRICGSTLLTAEPATRLGNDIQRYLVERTRLGIPAILHEESLHGLTAYDSVVHPQSIGLAAMWDPVRVERMGTFIGVAARARGARLVLSPVFDLARDPRWGRTEETYGEDTYVAMATGAAYTRGV